MIVSNRSLSRGLAIVRVFNEIPSPSLTEIATRVELTKATCLRYLRTLQDEGYVSLDEHSKRYQLRPLVLELGYAALSSLSLPLMAEAEMEMLADEIGGSVHLGLLEGDEVVVVGRSVASRETRKLITMNIHVGSRLPAHCSAMGRMLVAHHAEDIDAFVARMRITKMTPKTLIHRGQLAHEIKESFQRGWSLVEEDLGIGYSAIGTLIETGNQPFALAVSVHTKDYTRTRLVREVLPLLRAAAERLQRAFRHSSSSAGAA
ncbi:MAG: IclR family transcriptional regulator C-terminal domain-containing protein [Burkholderiaceae bacterium]